MIEVLNFEHLGTVNCRLFCEFFCLFFSWILIYNVPSPDIKLVSNPKYRATDFE